MIDRTPQAAEPRCRFGKRKRQSHPLDARDRSRVKAVAHPAARVVPQGPLPLPPKSRRPAPAWTTVARVTAPPAGAAHYAPRAAKPFAERPAASRSNSTRRGGGTTCLASAARAPMLATHALPRPRTGRLSGPRGPAFMEAAWKRQKKGDRTSASAPDPRIPCMQPESGKRSVPWFR
jgi:hypothetical protein